MNELALRALLSRYLNSPVLASVAKIVTGNLAVTLTQFATGFLMARWVLPGEMGVWNTAGVATLYFPVLSAGIYSGLNRELPYWIGRGEVKQAEAYASSAYAYSLALATLTSLVVGGTALWQWSHGHHLIAMTVLAAGATVAIGCVPSYLSTTYRTHSEFGRLSANNTLAAVAGLGLMVLVWRSGFQGMLIRAPLVAVIGLVAFSFRRPMPVAPRWNGRRLVALCKIGIPIFLLGQAQTFLLTMDRLSLVGDTEALGYYTLAIQAGAAAQMIPTAFGLVLFPRLAQLFGEADRAAPLWTHSKPAAVGATLLGGVVGVVGWMIIPWVVTEFLPNYKPGIAGAQWSCLLGLALGPYVFAHVFNVIRRQDLFAVCWAIGMGSFWGSRLVLGKMGGERTVVAAQALLVSAAALSVATMFASLWACRQHDRFHASSVAGPV